MTQIQRRVVGPNRKPQNIPIPTKMPDGRIVVLGSLTGKPYCKKCHIATVENDSDYCLQCMPS